MPIRVDERDVLGRTALMWAAMLPGDAGECSREVSCVFYAYDRLFFCQATNA